MIGSERSRTEDSVIPSFRPSSALIPLLYRAVAATEQRKSPLLTVRS